MMGDPMRKPIIFLFIVIEIALLCINALRFNRNEVHQFAQEELYVAHYDENSKTVIYEPGFYADHSSIDGSYVVTDLLNLNKGIYSVTISYSAGNPGTWHESYTTLESELDISNNKTANLVYSDHNGLSEGENTITYLSWVRYANPFRVRIGPETDDSGDDRYVLVNSVQVTYLKNRTIINGTLYFHLENEIFKTKKLNNKVCEFLLFLYINFHNKPII